MGFAEREKKSLNKYLGGPRKKKSINKYRDFFQNIFSFGRDGAKKRKILHFFKNKSFRLLADRLPHQIVSDFDDFCAVLKLSISAFQKPNFYQNPLRTNGVNIINQ